MDLDGALVLFSELIETLKCRPMHVDCVHWHYDVDRLTDTPSNTILPVYCIVRVTFRLIHNCFQSQIGPYQFCFTYISNCLAPRHKFVRTQKLFQPINCFNLRLNLLVCLRLIANCISFSLYLLFVLCICLPLHTPGWAVQSGMIMAPEK